MSGNRDLQQSQANEPTSNGHRRKASTDDSAPARAQCCRPSCIVASATVIITIIVVIIVILRVLLGTTGHIDTKIIDGHDGRTTLRPAAHMTVTRGSLEQTHRQATAHAMTSAGMGELTTGSKSTVEPTTTLTIDLTTTSTTDATTTPKTGPTTAPTTDPTTAPTAESTTLPTTFTATPTTDPTTTPTTDATTTVMTSTPFQITTTTTTGPPLKTTTESVCPQISSPANKVPFVSFGGGLNRPIAADVSSRGEIFVVDFGNQRIQVHNMQGALQHRFVPKVPGRPNYIMRPSDIAIDTRNDVWVVGFNYVVKYYRLGRPIFMIELAVGTKAYGVSVSRNSLVYVMAKKIQGGETMKQILVFAEQSGSFVKKFNLGLTTSGGGPFYLTVGSLIYISDMSGDQVDVYRSDGQHLFKFGDNDYCGVQLSKPRGIGTDRQGNVLVTSQPNGRVELYTSRGEFVRHVVTGLRRPKAVTVAPDGRVVVIDSSSLPVKIFDYE
ncbi:TRIM3 [Branchiostoma lanceolatum]|uniref:TRIM3 protein n=1 Tax=Branchiostoma lanceolatum TaxID=7740 RepID=A0A8K0E6H4_BRALA|nr:TRIM3 [Branchiostoma lanceolatum]